MSEPRLAEPPTIPVAIGRLLGKAGWAPLAVLVFHSVIQRTSLRQPLDFTVHYLGGAAIGFFFFHALECFERLLGRTTLAGRLLFSYGLACTGGVFWEFGELASDVFRHTHIQVSIHETMSDLIADATGAATSLAIVFLTTIFGRKR